jgi:hypothetical protein
VVGCLSWPVESSSVDLALSSVDLALSSVVDLVSSLVDLASSSVDLASSSSVDLVSSSSVDLVSSSSSVDFAVFLRELGLSSGFLASAKACCSANLVSNYYYPIF